MSKRIVIFDIDGTIADHGGNVLENTKEFLKKVREKIPIALIGGSPLYRIKEKLGNDVLKNFDYVFAENGLVAYKGEKLIKEMRITEEFNNKEMNEILNWVLIYIANLDLPIKRGTFVDFRTGLVNISPAGRHLEHSIDRPIWVEYDEKYGVRKKMVNDMREHFKNWNLQYVIGGQIGFDIFPKGWDKTFCLRYLEEYEQIYFIADKTEPEGNDYPLFIHDRTTAFTTKDVADTIKIATREFLDK
eukprot:TRINITY_DN15565_c0_g1_i1.p1 TRINITY_DN15565_c0_g1~~TRINITY_DN15565_c0_g1_i1.p1  ORF type:complete len:245 (+),score=62.46 TRINITY_DN15565_c0_g1_i1:44-778(+)